MKKLTLLIVGLVLVSFCLAGVAAAEKAAMKSATGKVTAIDADQIGIVIAFGEGKAEMAVGTIIDKDTMIKAKGKKTTLDQIKAGDTVTIKYIRSEDLHAKEIIKK